MEGVSRKISSNNIGRLPRVSACRKGAPRGFSNSARPAWSAPQIRVSRSARDRHPADKRRAQAAVSRRRSCSGNCSERRVHARRLCRRRAARRGTPVDRQQAIAYRRQFGSDSEPAWGQHRADGWQSRISRARAGTGGHRPGTGRDRPTRRDCRREGTTGLAGVAAKAEGLAARSSPPI